MRVFSHTPSNTEIVCALGCAHLLVGVDADSDYPPEVVDALPRAGRDLDLDADIVRALRPDLVLTSNTVPGHEKVVARLEAAGLEILVSDPLSLEEVYDDIRRIARVLGVPERGEQLANAMRSAMPAVTPHDERPRVLVEWWPKPLIAPAQHSWTTDMIHLAGGANPWARVDAKSLPMEQGEGLKAMPDIIVMSWCGVKQEKYRADIVRERPGWEVVPAVAANRILAVSETFLGRPGPRLVEGYRILRDAIAAVLPGIGTG